MSSEAEQNKTLEVTIVFKTKRKDEVIRDVAMVDYGTGWCNVWTDWGRFSVPTGSVESVTELFKPSH